MNAFITLNNELLLDLESFELIKDTYKNVVKRYVYNQQFI